MNWRYSLLAAGLAWAVVLVAQASAADEHPDFSGVWRNYRAASNSGDERTAWPADAPYTPEARRKVGEYQALIAGTGATPGGFCVGTGMPGSMLSSGGYPMEIIQRPEQVTIIYEAHNEVRRVYLDRHVDIADRIPTRNGYSTGRWEGDTFVVETTSLKEGVDQRSAHSAEARLIERYRLGGTDEDGQRLLVAELTMTDPRFYTEPVTVTKTWVAAEPGVRMLPYDCTEPDWEDFLEQRRSDLARTIDPGF